MAVERVGDWIVCVSKSTKAKYYNNPVTKASYWHDDSLPKGWAWGRKKENEPKFYVNLFTNELTPSIPTIPAHVTAESKSGASIMHTPPNDAHENRVPVNELVGPRDEIPNVEIESVKTNVLSSGLKMPQFPPPDSEEGKKLVDRCRLGFPMTRPRGIDVDIDDAYFGEEHKRILEQVLKVTNSYFASNRKRQMASLVRSGMTEEEAELEIGIRFPIYFDIGAGTGAATKFLLEKGYEMCQIFSIDIWDLHGDYYKEQLLALQHTGLADNFSRRKEKVKKMMQREYGIQDADEDASSEAKEESFVVQNPSYTQFCVNFWEHQNAVIPMNYPAWFGLSLLVNNGIFPSVIYIDADLSIEYLSILFRRIYRYFFDPNRNVRFFCTQPIIMGGGWDLSEDVRKAVVEFVRSNNLTLHVEQGKCWVMSKPVVTYSLNTEEQNLAVLRALYDSKEDQKVAKELTTLSSEAVEAATKKVWLNDTMGMVEEYSSIIAKERAGRPLQEIFTSLTPISKVEGASSLEEISLRLFRNPGPRLKEFISKLCRSIKYHGSIYKSSDFSIEKGSTDALRDKTWIDAPGEDKRCLTLLMRAARDGFVEAMALLADVFGATVNLQAERSRYTAILLATYYRHENAVRLLLARGADPLLVNKYGENAVDSAKSRNVPRILELLQNRVA